MASRMKVGELTADFRGDSRKFVEASTKSADSLKRVRRQGQVTQTQLKSLAGVAKGFGGALAAAFSVRAIVQFTNAAREAAREMGDLGAKLAEMAASVGVSVEGLQGLRRVFEGQGVATEKVDKALGRLNQRFGDAFRLKSYRDAFEQLGVDIDKLRESGAGTEEILNAVADGVKNTGDRAIVAASLAQLLGRDWQQLYLTLAEGSEGLSRARMEMEALGVVSGKQAQGLKAYAQALQNISNITQTQLAQATADQVPQLLALEEGIERIVRWWDKAKISAISYFGEVAARTLAEGIGAQITVAEDNLRRLQERYDYLAERARRNRAALEGGAVLHDFMRARIEPTVTQADPELNILATQIAEQQRELGMLRRRLADLGRVPDVETGTGTAPPITLSGAAQADAAARVPLAEAWRQFYAEQAEIAAAGAAKVVEIEAASLKEREGKLKEYASAWYQFYEEQDRLAREAAEEQERIAEEQTRKMEEAFGSFIDRVDFSNLNDVWDSAMKEMLRELIKFIFIGEGLLAQFGSGAGGGLLGFIGSLLGIGGGGGAIGGTGGSVLRGGIPTYGIPGGRAYGGPVLAGVPYTVGEMGRETFIPDQSGYVAPRGMMGGQMVFAPVIQGAVDPAAIESALERAYPEWERRTRASTMRDLQRNSQIRGATARAQRRG